MSTTYLRIQGMNPLSAPTDLKAEFPLSSAPGGTVVKRWRKIERYELKMCLSDVKVRCISRPGANFPSLNDHSNMKTSDWDVKLDLRSTGLVKDKGISLDFQKKISSRQL